MRITIGSYILILLLAFCFSGCLQQFVKMKPVPDKFIEELQKIEEPQDLEFTKYSIKRGDTIWKVSKEFGVSPDTIVQINQIADVKNIKPGQTLIIPASQKSQNQFVNPQIVKNHLPVSRQGFVWPIKNRILSQFGDYKKGSKNTGIDIEATLNDNVLAAKDGKVIVASNNSDGWGKTIVIEHVRNIHTWYAYNSEILVNKGVRVKQGQIIAKVGMSGKAERPKLHFKLFVNDKPVNPLNYLPR